jgi:hypothetical protein
MKFFIDCLKKTNNRTNNVNVYVIKLHILFDKLNFLLILVKVFTEYSSLGQDILEIYKYTSSMIIEFQWSLFTENNEQRWQLRKKCLLTSEQIVICITIYSLVSK